MFNVDVEFFSYCLIDSAAEDEDGGWVPVKQV